MVAAYVHNATSPELGKIGVLVALKSTADKDKLTTLARQIAMHVAAASPLAITPGHMSKDVVERERNIIRDQLLRNHVSVLEGTAKPPVDQPARPSGTDDLAVTLEPDFAGGITGQILALGVGQ